MKRIALFRYHNQANICINRIELFKHYNPYTPVYGLFGGPEENFDTYQRLLDTYLKGNYCLKEKPDEWKWKNGDLAIRKWYMDYGKDLDFDMLHILEWDLLMFESLDELYAHIPQNSLGVSGLTRLNKISNKWFWTRDPHQKSEWETLHQQVQQKYGPIKNLYASVAPGLCMPKSFLEQYAQAKVPELSHDELRITLFAQAMGFKLYDTRFFKRWFSKKEWKYFNCNNFNITWSTISHELSKKKGRRVFHPHRELVPLANLQTWYQPEYL